MKYRNKIINSFLLVTFALLSLSCAKQTAQNGTSSGGVGAQTPTEAYKMLFAAVKAKDKEKIRQMMSKSSLGFAEFTSGMQKKSVDEVLENGFVAPTLAPSLTEIRDERVKDTIGAIEVYNPQTKMWEELPFVKEDGGWKLAVGDIFQNTHDPNKLLGKGQAQIEREASNTGIPMLSNSNADNSTIDGKESVQIPPPANESKSVEVPKEDKPKQ